MEYKDEYKDAYRISVLILSLALWLWSDKKEKIKPHMVLFDKNDAASGR